MSELSELYQQVILDHNKKPRNFQKLEGANRVSEGFNPLCGDQLTVYMLMDEGVVQDMSFVGTGCAISKAAASMMTQAVKGKTREEAQTLFDEFHRMVTGELDEEAEAEPPRPSDDLRRRARLPRARQVRQPPVAHHARRARRRGAGHDRAPRPRHLAGRKRRITGVN